MRNLLHNKHAHRAFVITVFIKGIYGFLETTAGFVILFMNRSAISNFIIYLTQGELIEDPKDKIANGLINASRDLSINTRNFIAAYLIIFGIIKILLIFGLLGKKLWAYPISIAVISAFLIYQIYRLTFSHSIILVILIVLDALTVLLIQHKYQHLKHSQ